MDVVDEAEEDANSDKENVGKNNEQKVSTEGMILLYMTSIRYCTTGWANKWGELVGLTLILAVWKSAQFCFGRWGFGRWGFGRNG